jgi:hypothetical protein
MFVALGINQLKEKDMRNSRQLVGSFVIAAMMAVALLGTASTASADTGAPGGPSRSTCAFLGGILERVGNADAKEALAAIFDGLFGCDL